MILGVPSWSELWSVERVHSAPTNTQSLQGPPLAGRRHLRFRDLFRRQEQIVNEQLSGGPANLARRGWSHFPFLIYRLHAYLTTDFTISEWAIVGGGESRENLLRVSAIGKVGFPGHLEAVTPLYGYTHIDN